MSLEEYIQSPMSDRTFEDRLIDVLQTTDDETYKRLISTYPDTLRGVLDNLRKVDKADYMAVTTEFERLTKHIGE